MQDGDITEGGGIESLLLVLLAIVFGSAVLWRRLCGGKDKTAETPLSSGGIPLAKAKAINSLGKTFTAIPDQYHNLSQVQHALRKAGLESSDLIIGIDFTKSNTWQGEKTYGGKCLHHLDSFNRNPYERVIEAIGRCLKEFDDDQMIPTFGFGDSQTGDKRIFSLNENGPCNGFQEVLHCYKKTVERVRLSGPTNFAPLINTAAKIAQSERKFHILLIIADGQVTSKQATVDAIVNASRHAPLSIIMVGVGDGPWEDMSEFDDELEDRLFDNFQFVEFSRAYKGSNDEERDARFAMHGLMEIPDQYKHIKALGMIG